jgi:hypothetical protein
MRLWIGGETPRKKILFGGRHIFLPIFCNYDGPGEIYTLFLVLFGEVKKGLLIVGLFEPLLNGGFKSGSGNGD